MSLFEMISSIFVLDDNKWPFNNIKYSNPLEIHHMQKLSQLDKDVSHLDEVINMLNRKQKSLCKQPWKILQAFLDQKGFIHSKFVNLFTRVYSL